MPFLPPNQQHQSTEGRHVVHKSIDRRLVELTVGGSELDEVSDVREVGGDVGEHEVALLVGPAERRVGPRLPARHEHRLVATERRQTGVLATLRVEQATRRERQVERRRALVEKLHRQ